MKDSMGKTHVDNGDKEILFSKTIKAGKRLYYLDVKKNLTDDLFIAITESKKISSKIDDSASFERHRVFLYKEDFEKFMTGMNDVICFINNNKGRAPISSDEKEGTAEEEDLSEIKLQIDF